MFAVGVVSLYTPLIRCFPTLLAGLLGLIVASVAQAQSVTVEYRVLGTSTTGQVITQSLEVRVTNGGPELMISTSATISAMASIPLDPLGTVSIGDVPVGFTASRLADVSFSVANKATVQTSPFAFKLTFFDAAGRQGQMSVLGKQVP